MIKRANQTITGKAFEYSLLNAFKERLQSITNVQVIENVPYQTALKYYNSLNKAERSHDDLAASFAVNFLIDIEPRLSNSLSKEDILQLEIVSGQRGQNGDVRDVLAIRAWQKWEIGVSAKHHHRAVKHPRLSNDIDFGKEWLSSSCSQEYFEEIKPIFSMLKEIRKKSNNTQTWESLGNYHKTVYEPILSAFKKELERLNKQNPTVIANRLVKYLIGNQDFYKIIKGKGKVEIQAFNLYGSLNLPFENIKPKTNVPKLKLPNRLIEIVSQDDSNTTLLVVLNEGWQISFRIHNASSRIEPSLKFDVNLVSSPHTLFVNQLFLPQ